jgi:hypothetical protein
MRRTYENAHMTTPMQYSILFRMSPKTQQDSRVSLVCGTISSEWIGITWAGGNWSDQASLSF